MVARAARCASAPSELARMWDELRDETESEAPPSHARPTLTPTDEVRRNTDKAAYYLGCGEQGKAWNVWKGVEFVDPAAVSTAKAFAALTPQAAPPPPEVTADEPGTTPFCLRRATFDAQLGSLASARAGGTLHTVFETVRFVCEDPAAADAMFKVGSAILAGRAHQPAVDLICSLRAVVFLKPNGGLRPLGIGEAERRFFCGCLARQEKGAWDRLMIVTPDTSSF